LERANQGKVDSKVKYVLVETGMHTHRLRRWRYHD
jgi:hypothetical protein